MPVGFFEPLIQSAYSQTHPGAGRRLIFGGIMMACLNEHRWFQPSAQAIHEAIVPNAKNDSAVRVAISRNAAADCDRY